MTGLIDRIRNAAEKTLARTAPNPAAAPGPRPHKVFGIGFNKTGTSTLEQVFRHYGYRIPNQNEQERRLAADVFNTDYAGLRQFVENYDAFQDMPFSQGLVFVACDALFPDSKFILTIRDEDAWFDSLYRFHKKIFGFRDKSELTEDFFAGKNIYLYEGYVHANKARMLSVVNNGEMNIDWNLLYDADHYKKVYRERNDQIIKYFAKRPDKLLVLDITRERDTAKFCEFLGIPPDLVIDMPHENKT